jgi:uncharacterized membrane protein
VKLGFSALAERWRNSLFAVPLAFVLAGIALGQAGVALDREIGDGSTKLPLGLTSTVESARAVLSTVAGGTITVAGIAFSVSILTVQLASSQYSPRIVGNLFRDPFNKRVIGLVVGTFAYCLVVLRSVRSSIDAQGQPVIPNISVAVGVVLGITAILAVIAFINHNAHAVDISEILATVGRDAVRAVDDHWSADILEPSPVQRPEDTPAGDGVVVRFDRDGWVQLFDHRAMLDAVPEGSTVRFETAVGRYAVSGAPLCTIWEGSPGADRDTMARGVRDSIRVGTTRTLRQDASYGLRQMADVALRALSPGVNDPTTAQDAIFHLATVLHAFFRHDPPARDLRSGTRRLLLPEAGGYEELLALAYDEVRRAAASQPAVCCYLLESLSVIDQSLEPPRATQVAPLLREHARSVVEAAETAGSSDRDLAPVRRIYAKHFSP